MVRASGLHGKRAGETPAPQLNITHFTLDNALGSDYPMMTYDQLFKGWEAEEYPPEIMEKVYYKNAIKILGLDLSEEEFKSS